MVLIRHVNRMNVSTTYLHGTISVNIVGLEYDDHR